MKEILTKINKPNLSIRSYNNRPWIFQHNPKNNQDIPLEEILKSDYLELFEKGLVTNIYIKNKSKITKKGKEFLFS